MSVKGSLQGAALDGESTPHAGTTQRYLQLLRNCLTNTIYRDRPVDPWSKGDFVADKRERGLDWPSEAHTMIGSRRLENLQACAEHVLANDVPGDFIETGVWRGGAVILLRGVLEAYDVRDRVVWVADSFAGLPRPNETDYPADRGDQHHTYEELAVSLEQVQENFRRYDLLDDQVRFLKGWFKDTLPDAPIDALALLRIDGDMYESTHDAFSHLYPRLSPGGIVIVDDYHAVAACRRATHDYRNAHGITSPIHEIDGVGVFWENSVHSTSVREARESAREHRIAPVDGA